MGAENYGFHSHSDSVATDARARLTAYKIWLSDIKERQLQKAEGQSDFMDLDAKQVSRVNVIASVVDTFFADNYSALTLDDGSAQLRLKAFGDFVPKTKEIQAGDIIITIARLREYNNEVYLLPEILKKVTSKHALLRRLELVLEYGRRDPGRKIEQHSQGSASVVEQASSSALTNLKEKLKLQIAKLDEGEGVEMTLIEQKIGEKDKDKISEAIDELLGEGEAYEPRPGKIRLI